MRGHIIDPSERADVLAWLGELELTERLAMLLAMSFAFPILKNSKSWTRRIDECGAELGPTADQHVAIVMRAGQISSGIKEELSPVGCVD
jgi:hypothetical protein